jgi:hypothetical protein
MIALLRALAHGLVSSFRDRASLRLEIMALRHQLEALQRHNRGRVRLSLLDRAFWSLLYRFWSGCLDALVFVMPDTVVRWHRKGFRLYWTWKSRPRRRGRPEISAEVKALIGRMSRENPLWGAPRIHGELLKLGIGISAGHGLEVHGAASQAALAELADLPSEPRLLSGGRRFLRRSNPHLSHLVRLTVASDRLASSCGPSLTRAGTEFTPQASQSASPWSYSCLQLRGGVRSHINSCGILKIKKLYYGKVKITIMLGILFSD